MHESVFTLAAHLEVNMRPASRTVATFVFGGSWLRGQSTGCGFETLSFPGLCFLTYKAGALLSPRSGETTRHKGIIVAEDHENKRGHLESLLAKNRGWNRAQGANFNTEFQKNMPEILLLLSLSDKLTGNFISSVLPICIS